MGDRYPALLDEQILSGQGRSARTRAKLLRAAFEMLANDDVSAITVAGVTKKAGIAVGTFYLHYPTTTDLMLEVFGGFAEHDIKPALPTSRMGSGLFSEMKAEFVEIVAAFRRRRKFFRAMFTFRRQEERANEMWLRYSARWAAELSAAAMSAKPTPDGFPEFAGHAATAFADEIMTRIYIDDLFGAAFAEDEANDERVAELLAFSRQRLLYGVDPDPSLITINGIAGLSPPVTNG
ncbi:TetR/AcrR family transcriptional regulator [Novosphingobium gossypii]|uniref:TetR/AcrR family transcriptional regulator n=1 Tax=Novosphingobium gossypii TaxID=1604774 RepID=UPI003D2472AC